MSQQNPYSPLPPDDDRQDGDGADRRNRRGIDLTSLQIPMAMWIGLILVGALVLFFAIRPRGDETAGAPLTPEPTEVDFSLPVATFTPGPTSTPPPGVEPTAPPAESVDPLESLGGLTVGQPGRVANTGGSGVNLRNGPSIGAEALRILPDDTPLTLIGGPQEADGFQWWQVRLEDGTEGWTVEDFLSP